jgi:hypothetical protein
MEEIINNDFDILAKHKDILVAILMDLLMYEDMKLVDISFKLFN